jgi:hypothetical protein
MNAEDKKKLNAATAQIAKLYLEKKDIDDQIAEIVATTAEKLNYGKRNIRNAAKELNLTDVQRADKRLQEEELDQIRNALGILADTPLGQAAVPANDSDKKASRNKAPTHAAAHA